MFVCFQRNINVFIMELVYDKYYNISLIHPYLEQLQSDIVNKITQNIIVQYKGCYNDEQSNKKSCMFLHTPKKTYFEVASVLPHICHNQIHENTDEQLWESHIYSDRFVINNVIND